MRSLSVARFLTGLFICFVFHSAEQNRIIHYKETNEDFPNPERGFYHAIGTRAGSYELLSAEKLKSLRNPVTVKGATYNVVSTLIFRGFLLDTFIHSPLSDSFLENMKKDFQTARQAGMKLIRRFAYTQSVNSGNCPDQYKICPPYGDAPKDIVLQHIAQLKPILVEDVDVIAAVQMGFIGIWGENYFTDYFGDASMNGAGKIMDSSWRDRNEVLKALLDAVPRDRMIQVRTPQIKQRFVYGSGAPVTSDALNIAEAYTGTDKSRIGFHNDCFLSGVDDYGTFYDYGNSSLPRKPANEALRNYFSQDSKFVVIGGETCDDAFSPQNDCEPAGHAEKELREMHYSYLNAGYNNSVNNDWDSGGCINSIKRNLGYRLVLRSASISSKVKAGDKLHVHINLENVGYAAPYNPRPVLLLLRNATTAKMHPFIFKTDLRLWFTGNIVLDSSFLLPSYLTPGRYELLLYLPDKYPAIADRAEYSIRLANEDCWEKQTGYNKLNYIFRVKAYRRHTQ